MSHRFEHVLKDAEPTIALTLDIHDAPVRVWVDHHPYGEDDLCLVFGDGDAFRGWLDELLNEAERQNLVRRHPE